MPKIVLYILASTFCLSLTGCASYFKRKDCEKTNWFQHGHDVAMSGKRLNADPKVKECQEVEAKMSFGDLDTGFKAGMGKYCTGDNVFAVGKAGKPFAYDMCDGENINRMRARYEQGIRAFCVPTNGYRFGSTGGVYQDVCPQESEEAFLSEYRKGRKIHLASVIAEKEREVSRLGAEALSLERERQSLNMQAISLSHATVERRERVLDAQTGTYREQITRVPDEDAKLRGQRITNEISSLNYKIDGIRKQQSEIEAELSKMRMEMAGL